VTVQRHVPAGLRDRVEIVPLAGGELAWAIHRPVPGRLVAFLFRDGLDLAGGVPWQKRLEIPGKVAGRERTGSRDE
jgi:hypothetical protein